MLKCIPVLFFVPFLAQANVLSTSCANIALSAANIQHELLEGGFTHVHDSSLYHELDAMNPDMAYQAGLSIYATKFSCSSTKLHNIIKDSCLIDNSIDLSEIHEIALEECLFDGDDLSVGSNTALIINADHI